MQWLFIFISRVLSNPAAAFGESPGFDGSACVVASRMLPFAVASWFLVSGAVPVTSLATAGAAPEGLLELDAPGRGRLVVTRCFLARCTCGPARPPAPPALTQPTQRVSQPPRAVLRAPVQEAKHSLFLPVMSDHVIRLRHRPGSPSSAPSASARGGTGLGME